MLDGTLLQYCNKRIPIPQNMEVTSCVAARICLTVLKYKLCATTLHHSNHINSNIMVMNNILGFSKRGTCIGKNIKYVIYAFIYQVQANWGVESICIYISRGTIVTIIALYESSVLLNINLMSVKIFITVNAAKSCPFRLSC